MQGTYSFNSVLFRLLVCFYLFFINRALCCRNACSIKKKKKYLCFATESTDVSERLLKIALFWNAETILEQAEMKEQG